MKKTSLSSGAVPVRFKNNKWEFLILRAFSYWDFPKGMVEKDEDPWAGALRELEEETGLSSLSTPWGKDFFETEPYGKGKVARYYLVRSDEDKDILLIANPFTGIIEHHEFRWLSYDNAKDLLVPRVQEVLEWANKKITAEN